MEDKTVDIHTDLLTQLRHGDSAAIRRLYQLAFPSCARFVKNNSGTQEDAKDLFQESLMVLIKNLRKADFELTCTVKTYLYSVMRNLWLKRLNRKDNLQLDIDEPEKDFILIEENEIEEKQAVERQHELIADILRHFKEDCRKLLVSFYFKKMSLKEIAKIMDYTYSFARVKKTRCMDALKKEVERRTGGGEQRAEG